MARRLRRHARTACSEPHDRSSSHTEGTDEPPLATPFLLLLPVPILSMRVKPLCSGILGTPHALYFERQNVEVVKHGEGQAISLTVLQLTRYRRVTPPPEELLVPRHSSPADRPAVQQVPSVATTSKLVILRLLQLLRKPCSEMRFLSSPPPARTSRARKARVVDRMPCTRVLMSCRAYSLVQ